MIKRTGLALALVSCATEVQGFPSTFVGVGIELRIEDGRPEVVRVIPGGPAEIAGVQPKDRIMTIDGKSTEDQSLGEVVMHLRGEPETQVTLTVVRGGERVMVVVKRRAMAKVDSGYKPN